MKNLFLSLAISLTFLTFAEEGSKPLELPDTSKLNMIPGKSGAKFEMRCKTEMGHTVKQGEAGYETCMSKAQPNMHDAKGAGASRSGSTGEATFTFGE